MMFSTNPFPHIFPPSDSFHGQQKDDLYTDPFLSGECLQAKHDLVQELDLDRQCDEYNHRLWSELKNKKASKKDHHSKIHTAQGPRDRRVRLSIEVAKKFFYLQDLLGNDKASKTLDWLFQQSKISIDELIERKKQSPGSSGTDQSEGLFMETGSDEQKCGEGKRKKIVARKYKSGFSVSQLRAEARARARERTKEKLNFKKLDSEPKSVHVDCCSSNLTLQSSFWNSVESQNDYDSSSKFTALPRFGDVNEQPGDFATI